MFQVRETLSDDVLKKMKAPPKDETVPIITADQLPEADGILFGMPTRFGMVPAQMKALFDSCGQLWLHGKLFKNFFILFWILAYFIDTCKLSKNKERIFMLVCFFQQVL